MFGRLWVRLRPAVFWGFPRGSWQYDVIVGLILVFIFATPSVLFNDRPSQAVVHEVEYPTADARVFWIDPGALDRADPQGASERLNTLLLNHSGEDLRIIRTEPARDEVGNVQAYLVFAQPRPDPDAADDVVTDNQ